MFKLLQIITVNNILVVVKYELHEADGWKVESFSVQGAYLPKVWKHLSVQ
jgi:hypothetical protein